MTQYLLGVLFADVYVHHLAVTYLKSDHYFANLSVVVVDVEISVVMYFLLEVIAFLCCLEELDHSSIVQ